MVLPINLQPLQKGERITGHSICYVLFFNFHLIQVEVCSTDLFTVYAGEYPP